MTPAIRTLIDRLDGMAPKTAIVLGSGLGGLVDEVAMAKEIAFEDLEGFPVSGVSGHSGKLVAGFLSSKPVILLSGRVHYYEAGDAAAMRTPIETLKGVGVENLILTNAAGSLREDIPPGYVMQITDHIDFSGRNPLIGEPTDKRFVGLTNAYDPALREALQKSAQAVGIDMKKGVYMWFSGPAFETPAEIRAAGILGADAVGMSTVPEVILGRFFDMKIAAFSVITNMAAGITGDELSHNETKEMAPRGGADLARILSHWLETQ